MQEIRRDVKPEEWRNKRVPPYCGRVMPDRSIQRQFFQYMPERFEAHNCRRRHQISSDVGVSSVTSTLWDVTEMTRDSSSHLFIIARERIFRLKSRNDTEEGEIIK